MKGSRTVLLVMILPVLVTTEQDVSPINRDIGFQFDNFPGFKLSLQDRQFHQRTTLVPDQMGCVFECVRETWCLSVNFNTTKEKGLHTCELMSAVMYDHPENFTRDNNFIHLSIKNPCAEKPCQNGGECTIRNNRQDYKCKCKKGFSGENCQNALVVTVFVYSEGCEDTPEPPQDRCGWCIIKVNDGVNLCPNKRGHNVVVLDKYGVYQTKGVFDTHRSAAQDLKNFLTSLQQEHIVLIAVMDSGEHVGEAAAALQAVGAVNPTAVSLKSSWLLVGYKGGSPSWITEKRADRGKGPSQANVTIPVPVT